jgi:hypothetical protein
MAPWGRDQGAEMGYGHGMDMPKDMHDLKHLREDLKDELLAINNYQMHIDATDNHEIQKVLGHIRDEEKEHFAELVQLIRKLDPTENDKFIKEEQEEA